MRSLHRPWRLQGCQVGEASTGSVLWAWRFALAALCALILTPAVAPALVAIWIGDYILGKLADTVIDPLTGVPNPRELRRRIEALENSSGERLCSKRAGRVGLGADGSDRSRELCCCLRQRPPLTPPREMFPGFLGKFPVETRIQYKNPSRFHWRL
jgi:hypothetical protein